MFLSVRNCWFHNMVNLLSRLDSTEIGTGSYRCLSLNWVWYGVIPVSEFRLSLVRGHTDVWVSTEFGTGSTGVSVSTEFDTGSYRCLSFEWVWYEVTPVSEFRLSLLRGHTVVWVPTEFVTGSYRCLSYEWVWYEVIPVSEIRLSLVRGHTGVWVSTEFR